MERVWKAATENSGDSRDVEPLPNRRIVPLEGMTANSDEARDLFHTREVPGSIPGAPMGESPGNGTFGFRSATQRGLRSRRLLSPRGLERPCETLVAWAREA
jgi:hypothetical protein